MHNSFLNFSLRLMAQKAAEGGAFNMMTLRGMADVAMAGGCSNTEFDGDELPDEYVG